MDLDSKDINALLNLIKLEENAIQNTLHLTANENVTSNIIHSILASPLAHRYHLGTSKDYQLNRVVHMKGLTFRGLKYIYELENLARQTSHKILEALDSDFRPLSGVHAMMSSLLSISESGDVIYSIDPEHGGHFATRNIIERILRKSCLMKFDLKTFNIDLNYLEQLVKISPPNVIVFDHGATLFELPLDKIRAIVGCDVKIIYDASHVFGLIYGKVFENPLKLGCDILQANTHKTFPGPQKGIIFFHDTACSEKIIESISKGMVSSQHTHHSLVLYMTLLEMEKYGYPYSMQMVKNAQTLAKALHSQGINILNVDGVHTNTNTLFITAKSIEKAKSYCEKLQMAHISTNAREVYGYPVIRIGTQEITRRGMKEEQMIYIAELIAKLVNGVYSIAFTQQKVIDLLANHIKLEYSFDNDIKSTIT